MHYISYFHGSGGVEASAALSVIIVGNADNSEGDSINNPDASF